LVGKSSRSHPGIEHFADYQQLPFTNLEEKAERSQYSGEAILRQYAMTAIQPCY